MTDTEYTRLVSDEVRAEMARRKIRQVEIARLLGLSQASVSARLNGQIPWDVNELQLIAERLGIDVAKLLPEQVTR